MYSRELKLAVIAAFKEEKIYESLKTLDLKEILYLKTCPHLPRGVAEMLGEGLSTGKKGLVKSLLAPGGQGEKLRAIFAASEVDEVREFLGVCIDKKENTNLDWYLMTKEFSRNQFPGSSISWEPGAFVGDFYDPKSGELLKRILNGKMSKEELLEILNGYYVEVLREAAVRSLSLSEEDVRPFLNDESYLVASGASWRILVGQKIIWLSQNIDFVQSLTDVEAEFFINLYPDDTLSIDNVLRLIRLFRSEEGEGV